MGPHNIYRFLNRLSLAFIAFLWIAETECIANALLPNESSPQPLDLKILRAEENNQKTLDFTLSVDQAAADSLDTDSLETIERGDGIDQAKALINPIRREASMLEIEVIELKTSAILQHDKTAKLSMDVRNAAMEAQEKINHASTKRKKRKNKIHRQADKILKEALESVDDLIVALEDSRSAQMNYRVAKERAKWLYDYERELRMCIDDSSYYARLPHLNYYTEKLSNFSIDASFIENETFELDASSALVDFSRLEREINTQLDRDAEEYAMVPEYPRSWKYEAKGELDLAQRGRVISKSEFTGKENPSQQELISVESLRPPKREYPIISSRTRTTPSLRSTIKSQQFNAGAATSQNTTLVSESITMLPDEEFGKHNANTSSQNRIAIDSELPRALFFRVQVGVFKEIVPTSFFKGYAPINAETTTSGLFKYTIGAFRSKSSADNAKQQLIKEGYKDAFIVAYYNGKRITILESNDLISQARMPEPSPTTFVQNWSKDANKSIGDQGYGNGAPRDQRIKNVHQIKGENPLFYTVQVGFFSKPLGPGDLMGFKSLNEEITEAGYIRYSSKVFPSLDKAIQYKNNISSSGISDAFVTAYFQGRRVTIQDAQKHEADRSFLPKPIKHKQVKPKVAVETVARNSTKQTPDKRQDTPRPPASKSTKLADAKKHSYTIFLGQYDGEFPKDKMPIVRRQNIGEIKVSETGSGMKNYTVGEFQSKKQAFSSRDQLVRLGFIEARVVKPQDLN